MKKHFPQKGFTLVEVIASIAIISLVSVLATPNFLRVREHAKEVAAQETLKTIHYAMRSYRDVNFSYPSSLVELAPAANFGYAYLDEAVANGAKLGYAYQVESSDADRFFVSAIPQDAGVGNRIFMVDERGEVREGTLSDTQ